jgi:prepilin-type N-terminal cleavage/methylation domain-containing protein
VSRAQRDESGLTLVECLVTVVIMGLAFVALLGGLGTSIFASDVHRKQATAETVLRSFAEHVKTEAYVPCAGSSTYGGSFSTSATGYSPSVTAVAWWNATSGAFDATACTTATDPGLQRLTLQVRSSDERATESVQIAKRKP